MMPPAETRVGVSHGRESVASQNMKHCILDFFDSRREVGHQVPLVCIEAQNNKVGKKFGNPMIRPAGSKDFLINLWQVIRCKATGRVSSPLNRAKDLGGVKSNERMIALSDFPNSIQYRHDHVLSHVCR